MISPNKDKIDEVYASIQVYFNIENDGELNKCFGIELYHRPDGSIHLSHSYLTKKILNTVTGIYQSSTNTTPAVKTP